MRFRKKRLWFWILQTVIVSFMFSSVLALPEVIKIGGLFETDDSQQDLAFRKAIEMINSDESKLLGKKLQAKTKEIPPQDSFRALKTACDFLEEGVAAFISPKSPSNIGVLQSVSDTFGIPLIQTHWAPGNQVRTHSVNFYPDSRGLARAFSDFMIIHSWKSFTLIYEDNEALIRLQEILQLPSSKRAGSNIKIMLRHAKHGQDFSKMMKDLYKQSENNFVLDLSLPRVKQLFNDADKVSLMTEYQSYLLTSLDTHTENWTNVGLANISAFRIINPENEKFKRFLGDWIFSEQTGGRNVISKQPITTEAALLYDAMMMLTRTLDDLDRIKAIPVKPLFCDGQQTWSGGTSIVNHMKILSFDATTGSIKIDRNGTRSFFKSELVKISSKGISKAGDWDPEKGLILSKRGEGEEFGDILEILKNKTLRVTTKLTAPYMSKRVSDQELKGNDRYEGFCKQLLDKLSEIYHFKYTIKEVADGNHGKKLEDGSWNGMIGELLRKEADIAIADLSITYEREEAVDFTMPWMTLGISILFKKPDKKSPPMFSFLQPLSLEVWFYMGTAYLGVSLFMFILARLSPYEWVNPHPCDQENDTVENQFTLLNCFWFTIGSIMQQGSDILPRAISTRIVASSWWFFTLIMISSYTANLAAFLTSQRMTSPITDAKDLARQTQIQYGCVEGGSTQSFFRNSTYPIYKRMWSFMESQRPSVFTKTNADGIGRVKMGNYAFLMESTSIDYITERNCELMKIGGELDSKGYGIALPPGSPYRGILSSGILKLQETQTLTTMKNHWWLLNTRCVEDGGADSAEMGIGNVGGVFLVLGIGSLLGAIIVVMEFIWKANKMLERESIPRMLWHELRSTLTCRGSSRPVPKEAEEPSVEKMPMVNMSKIEDYKFS